MKKLVVAALAAVVATVSLSSVAEAGWRWRHHGWHGHHHNYWGGPRIVIRPAYYGDYCFIKKVRRYDDYGNVYVKRIRVCD
jgi:hypothetical protein